MRWVQRKERDPPVSRPPAKKAAMMVDAVSFSSLLTCLKEVRGHKLTEYGQMTVT